MPGLFRTLVLSLKCSKDSKIAIFNLVLKSAYQWPCDKNDIAVKAVFLSRYGKQLG